MVEIDINNTRKVKVGQGEKSIIIDGSQSTFEVVKLSHSSYKIIGTKSIYDIEVVEEVDKEVVLSVNNQLIKANISDHIDQILEKLGINVNQNNTVKEIKAPMPGSILDVMVKEGDEVKANDQLLVLEAMKMENVIKSPGDSIVGKIHISEKQNVEKNQVLISFE